MLSASNVVVSLLSPSAIEDARMASEWRLATRYGVPLVLYQVRSFPNGVLPGGLAEKVIIDAASSSAVPLAFRRLVTAIEQSVAPANSPASGDTGMGYSKFAEQGTSKSDEGRRPRGLDFDLYISASEIDSRFVLQLEQALIAQGIVVRVDREAGRPMGRQREISEIEASATIGFVVSPNAVHTVHWRNQLEIARRHQKPLIAIHRARLEREQLLPPVLRAAKSVDFTSEVLFEAGVERLIGLVHPGRLNDVGVKVAEGDTVAIGVKIPGRELPQLFVITRDLYRLLARSNAIQEVRAIPAQLTFDAILFALLTARDPLVYSLRSRFESSDAELLSRSDGLRNASEVAAIIEREDSDVLALTATVELTPDASAVLLAASAHQDNLLLKPESGRELGLTLRDLVGAVIYEEGSSRRFQSLTGVDTRLLAESFLSWISANAPREHAYWTSVHSSLHEPVPISVTVSTPIEYQGAITSVGASAHITSDQWTDEDALGYRIYAEAIAGFLRNPETRAPLTISVQAPWGGGKTSLMRMVESSIDPVGALKRRGGQKSEAGKHLTIWEVVKELRKSTQPETSTRESEDKDAEAFPSVWFNAWKYQSTNQIWAGLAHAIMSQIADRLSPSERELFWLRLQLSRIDHQTIRLKIHERILGLCWQSVKRALPFAVGIAAASALLIASGLEQAGTVGVALSAVMPVALGVSRYIKGWLDTDAEPAAFSLGEYLDVPKYASELGFIHHVAEDLNRVLRLVRGDKPAVIFIDDLDRCSPNTVADVMEAINLFLCASDGFPECIFVLGIDAEMVAAALESAHGSVISRLATDDCHTPIGWRFMDKFVQLPIVLPPPTSEDLERYKASLFVRGSDGDLGDQYKILIQQLGSTDINSENFESTFDSWSIAANLSDAAVAVARVRAREESVIKTIREKSKQTLDKDAEFKKLVDSGQRHFSGNPRELKRFVNLLRFWYSLRFGLIEQGREVPGLDTLVRWTVFSLRWPQVVRWLRRGSGGTDDGLSVQDVTEKPSKALGRRIMVLEQICSGNPTLVGWQDLAGKRLHLDARSVSWLSDQSLLRFMGEESSLAVESRISHWIGKGGLL